MTNAIVRAGDINLDELQRTAKMLAVSGYFDVAKNDMTVAIAQMATKILAGAEMGYGPFASVQGIHLIQGKPSISANLMASAVKNHPRYDYRVRKLSNTECELEFFELVDGKRESLGLSRFDENDAKNAGLLGKDIWKKHPKNMYFARAMSNGVRFYTPDIFAGNVVYAPEEMGAELDSEGNLMELTVRVVDDDTGEIMDPYAHIPSTPAQQSNGPSPYKYADLIDALSGTCGTLANQMRATHAQSDGPASDKQYQYLADVLDNIVDKKGAHNAILEVVVGRPVTGANPPGKALASKLLDYLVATRNVDDVEVANVNYREDVVNCVRSIWDRCLEAEGQLRLVEA